MGQLWLALKASGDAKYRLLAEAALARLEVRLERDNVLNGLVFYYGAALGGLLHGNAAGAKWENAEPLPLRGTTDQARASFPLGHDSGSLTADDVGKTAGETNIDGVPGMGLLWWAAHERGEPALAEIAAKHVRRHIDLCMRPDGSLYQAALVDPANGATLRLYSPRGYAADTSTWARAQSWGLLGFVQAYAWTKDAFSKRRSARSGLVAGRGAG